MDRLSTWRLITHDGVSASAGLAADEALTGRVGQGQSVASLRLYTYQDCALVGRFQNIHNELRVERCQARGMPLNRRPTGGGAIVMGPDQLGVALVLPAARKESFARTREMMGEFAQGLVGGLARLGVQAAFRGKNDLEVDGRKLAGLGIFRHPRGGVLFHASVLVDFDVALMLDVLNTPFEKITHKEIATVTARTSTIRKEAGSAITLDQARLAVAEGMAEAFGVSLEPGDFDEDEQAAIVELETGKYHQQSWIFQTLEVTDSFGGAKIKTPLGLLDIRVTMAGDMVKAVFIAGDFFAAEAAVASLEGQLRWHASKPAAIAETVQRIYGERGDELSGLPLAELLEAINTSVINAINVESGAGSDPYACFATPPGTIDA